MSLIEKIRSICVKAGVSETVMGAICHEVTNAAPQGPATVLTTVGENATTPAAAAPSREELLAFARASLKNCRAIAQNKSGADLLGWEDDARHWRGIILALSRAPNTDAPLPHNFDPARDVACTRGEYAQLVSDARRYEWLRDNMTGKTYDHHFTQRVFYQPVSMSFQEAVDLAMATANDERIDGDHGE